jgi:hypothetical protein
MHRSPQGRIAAAVLCALCIIAIRGEAISTSRVAHVFSQDEDIVITTVTGTGSVNYTIEWPLFTETLTGTAQIVNGTIRIPAYGLVCGPCRITVQGQTPTLNAAIVPGIIRYSDHLVTPVWQHIRVSGETSEAFTVSPAGHAYLFLQLGFGGTNFGDTLKMAPQSWRTFQAHMCREGLWAQGKEGWRPPWPLTEQEINTWATAMRNDGVTRMICVLGNEVETQPAPTWPYGEEAWFEYTRRMYRGIKQVFPEPDSLVGGNDDVTVTPWSFFDNFFSSCAAYNDFFSFHQTAMGVDTTFGEYEGDVHTWVRTMKRNNISRPMLDGECMCGADGQVESGHMTYWHAKGILDAWPTVETAIVGGYVRGVVHTHIFNPGYEGRPLWDNKVNPMRDLTAKVVACRTISDWCSGFFPLGRIDTGDYRTDYPFYPHTEVWAMKRGNLIGLWTWTNKTHNPSEDQPIMRKVEIRTRAQYIDVIDNQGNVGRARVTNGVLRFRINPVSVVLYGFPEIPQITPVDFPNQAPQINSTPVTEAVVGAPYVYDVKGYHAEDYLYQWRRHIATYSLQTAPSGMTIGAYSGLVRWTPTAAQVGTHNVTIRYRDPDGLYEDQSFTITVKPAGENVGPYFVSNPPRVAPINKQYFYAPKAVDPNGDAVTYSLVSGPAGMAFAGSTLTWTPTASMGTEVTIQASDGRGGVATQTWDLASGVVAIRTRGGWPNAPGNLTGTPGAGTSVVLSWQDNSSGDREEKGFVVERSSVAPPGDINLRFGTSCYVDNRPFVMVHVTEANETTWTDTPPQAGTYWYRVKAVNHIADWGGYSNIVQVTAGGGGANQPPVITLTSPANGSTYGAPANITLAATATDPDGNVQGVTFWSGGTLLNTDNASPWTYTWANVSSGTYQLRAVAQDNLGATSTSAVVNVTVTWTPPGNSSPTVSIVSPVTGSTFTTGSTITIAATASDSDGSIAAVRFYSGTTLLGTDSTSPYSYTWVNVAAGSYALTAQAQDNEGAVRTSAVVNITVSTPNQPPVVSLTSPVNNSTYTAPATIQLTATATDSDGSIAHVRFYRGSTLLNTDSASPYEYTWTNVSSGTYQLRAVAQDNQGATSTSTIITVTVLSSSTPAVWYTLTATANPANGGTISPASGTYLAGSQIQVTATPNANYTFATWSGNASGTNPTVTITMDSDKSITANFTYVPPMNQPPVVNITAPSPGARYSAPASIAVSATASDSDGSIVSVGFYYTTTMGPNPGVVFLGSATAAPYQYTWANVGAGEYGIIARAKDDLDAVTSASVYVIVDPAAQPELTPGEVRIVGGLDGYINATANPNVTIRFRRTTAGVVTVRIYDLRGRLVVEKNKDGVAGIDDDIAWNAAELPAGVYIVRVSGGGISHARKMALKR